MVNEMSKSGTIESDSYEHESEDFYDDDELECTWCGGEGIQENDDPLWHGFECFSEGWNATGRPTHWMPLPPPPTSGEAG